MRLKDIDFNPTEKTLRQFGWLAFVFFVAIGIYQYFAYNRQTLGITLALSGIVFVVVGVAKPRLLRPVFVGWMILAFPIGWCVSHLILGLIFYGCFVPLGWLLRLRGHDPLQLKRPTKVSYWQDRPSQTDVRRYLKQY